jgi:hypothetical protein
VCKVWHFLALEAALEELVDSRQKGARKMNRKMNWKMKRSGERAFPALRRLLTMSRPVTEPQRHVTGHSQHASAQRRVDFGRLEAIIAEDHGKRGIAPLVLPGELARAAYHLGQCRAASACQHVAVLTGYPCCPGSPPTETDGPLGAIATARALVALGKRATILTDSINEVRCVPLPGAASVAQVACGAWHARAG